MDVGSLIGRAGVAIVAASLTFGVGASAAGAETITGGVEVSGVCVEAFSADAGRNGAPVDSDISDSIFFPGHWDLEVPPGNYKVRFAACGGPSDSQFQPEWYDHLSGWGSAITIPVAPGQTRDLGRFSLPAAHPMGTITGSLTAPDGTPASGWCAVALDPAGSGFDGFVKTYDVTDADGSYAIQYLRTGTWKVFFTTRCGGFKGTRFDEEYYNDKSSFGAADAVTVADGQTTAGVDATLNWLGGFPPGGIQGTVTVGGTPRAGVCVGILDPATGTVLRGTVTSLDGVYGFGGLSRGSYKVVAGTSECSAAQGPALPRMFFNGQSDFASAQEIPVVYSIVTGIDMAYAPLPAEIVSKNLAAGETLSSDTGAGATQADPLVTEVTTPTGGQVTITELDSATTAPPAGFSLLGHQVEIDARPGTVSSPLRLLFKLDASVIAGLDPTRIAPLRDGELAADCVDSNRAEPDPCVENRIFDPTTGDLVIKVNAVHASTWNFTEVPKRCVVPDLVGMKLTKAKKALAQAKCKLGTVKKKASKKKAGTVIGQKPKAGSVKPVGAKVAVTVSKG